MRSVGIRELRQNASALVRRVEAGESVGITDRGRPVAVLGPFPRGSSLSALRELGETTPAVLALDELGPPLVAARGKVPSRILARLRRDER